MNIAILMGRLTKDPELKLTSGGISVCSFTVACDRRFAGDDNKADFINCVAWRHTAEFICKYFKKGAKIALEGSISVRSWEDGEGNKRYVTEVVAEHAEFGESSKSTDFANDSHARMSQENKQENRNGHGPFPTGDIDGFMPVDLDEDLPF